MTLALLCGGQGTLGPEMFRLTAHDKRAEPIYKIAKKLLGKDAREIVMGRADAFSANRVSQILAATSTLSLHACIADVLPTYFTVTGYSVGEMAAWSIAGVWTAEVALQLTARRAAAMDEVDGGHGQLGYVRGLSRGSVARLAHSHDSAIAIANPDNLFIVGGAASNIDALCKAAIGAGAAKAAPIAVHVASHTSRLKGAIAPFRHEMERAKHGDVAANRCLIAGRDGVRVFDAVQGMHALAETVAHVIDWAGTLEVLHELGVSEVLDLGPGHALKDMATTTGLFDRCHAADGFRTIEGLRDWLSRK